MPRDRIQGEREVRAVQHAVTVFGAYGHTGRFVAAELRRRGWSVILSGRDAEKLAGLHAAHPGLEVRAATVNDPASLDRALAGAAAVINCAGPFLDTATPVIEAALRAGIHYLDVTAEQQAVLDTFARHGDAAKRAEVVVLPSMAFYGGLADLLVTAALDGRADADTVDIAVALDGWHTTAGTRQTGRRNHYPRLNVTAGRLAQLADPPATRDWTFPAPFGSQAVVALPLAETITVSRHLRVRELRSWMNLAPLADLRDPDTPPPTAADAQGRSSQQFVMQAMIDDGRETRRVAVLGRDIYATTAPLAVEAVDRILAGGHKTIGVTTAGAAFDAGDFLAALTPDHLRLD